MKSDSRLSGVLHILLHLAEHKNPVRSEVLAKAMDTHPVVIRRILAGLRECGYVRSGKGHGGGWTMACDLSAITLLDIYIALGSPPLFALGNRSEMPGCLVEQSVNSVLNGAFQEAQERLIARFGKVTLARLSADLHRRIGSRRKAHQLETIHAA